MKTRRKARTWRMMVSPDNWIHTMEIGCKTGVGCKTITLREVLPRPRVRGGKKKGKK